MVKNRVRVKRAINKGIAALVAVSLLVLSPGVGAAAPQEAPEAAYGGIGNADVVLNNLNYSDIKNASEWIKDAVYETGALNLIKGYGNRQYGLTTVISKASALSAIYTAVGREAEAQQLGEALNSVRAAEDKKTDTLSIWADGFLQLGANEGLISQQDLIDALQADQASLEQESFNRNAAAQRQEVADWLAKVLQLEPVYDQQNVFNNFRDWKSADSAKIPYIEAVLQSGIMNGDNSGNFKPRSAVNREQMAQIIKNSEDILLPLSGMDRKTGTIEEIKVTGDYSGNNGAERRTFNVRNSNGMLHTIDVEYLSGSTTGNRNESTGSSLSSGQKELVVLKNGALGKSSLLKQGDRIEYITASDNTVKYVKVLSSVYDTKYYVAKVNSIDTGKRSINTAIFFKLDYPDIDLSQTNISFDLGSENAIVNYTYSNNVSVTEGKKNTDIKSVIPESYVILTVKNNIVTGIKTLDLANGGEKNVVQGIVEENNPQMGYITLYNEDGTGVSSQLKQDLSVLRTYSYGNQNELEVLKNHKNVDLEDIEAGDTVFLKLDSSGNVVSLSAADNYTVKYGKVVSKGTSSLAIRFDNGSQQVLTIDKNVRVLDSGKLTSYSSLKNGDRVRLLLNITDKATVVKEITVEGDENYISKIYKAKISGFDKTSGKVVTWNPQIFNAGRWVWEDQRGAKGIKLADEYSMFYDDKGIDMNEAKKYLKDNEAYIAVKKDYGGEELAVFISFRNENDAEDEPYNDSVTYTVPGTGEFNISKKQEKIKNTEGTIIVKDGRLVSANSILTGDAAYIVANRSDASGDYLAGIVQIDSNSDIQGTQLYRARITLINEMRSFTVQSFSQLNNLSWDYSNTPKTFNITQNTRIIDDEGVVNQSEFTDYGDNTYANRTVYILANGINSILITTAPYGTVNAKGEVFELTGAEFGEEEGTLLTEPTGLRLTGARVYDQSKYLWVDSKDMTLNLLTSSIILKGGKVIKPSDIKKGDNVRVIKQNASETGDAYIVIVE